MLSNKYVTAIVAVLFMIVLAYNIRFFAARIQTPGQVSSGAAAVDAAGSAGSASNLYIRLPLKKDPDIWKRDPFSMEKQKSVTRYNLTGIIKRDGRSLALINGKVYGVNDRAGNAVIKSINKENIMISVYGIERELYIDKKSDIKERAK